MCINQLHLAALLSPKSEGILLSGWVFGRDAESVTARPTWTFVGVFSFLRFSLWNAVEACWAVTLLHKGVNRNVLHPPWHRTRQETSPSIRKWIQKTQTQLTQFAAQTRGTALAMLQQAPYPTAAARSHQGRHKRRCSRDWRDSRVPDPLHIIPGVRRLKVHTCSW